MLCGFCSDEWKQSTCYRCRFLFKGDFSVVVHSSLFLPLLLNIDSCCSQLPALLQSSQTPETASEEHSGVSSSLFCTPEQSPGMKYSRKKAWVKKQPRNKKVVCAYLTWLPPAVSLWPSSWLSYPGCWPVEPWPLTASPTHLQTVRQTNTHN